MKGMGLLGYVEVISSESQPRCGDIPALGKGTGSEQVRALPVPSTDMTQVEYHLTFGASQESHNHPQIPLTNDGL